ncbi:hypothetical protein [Methyloversatilis sp.]|uniref:hypothetical protein n=1 Tax=Methyloversatilis sp. TaxID=2569862 RepID=UPI003D26E203
MGDIAEALRKIGARDLAGGGMTQGTRPPFEEKPAKGAKPPAVARAKAQSSGGGGGDDLQETAAADREYWTDETLTTTDGAFVWVVRPIKRVKLTTGRSIRLADPTP